MSSFSLLVFQGPRLVGSEQFQASSIVEAIEICSGRNAGYRVELWTDGKLAARLGPAVGRHDEGA